MNKSMRRRTLIVLGVAALAGAVAQQADAGRGPCIPGKRHPLCYHWDARVTAVHDGDTIAVNTLRDGSRARQRVRLTGINAMELKVYSSNPDQRRGYCHAVAATSRLQRLIRSARNRVRLSAQRPSSRSGPRLRRMVAVRSHGRWVDLGQLLINEGHVLFHPNRAEWARNARYAAGAQRAARRGLRLWDTDFCGRGPSKGARLRMWVNWDADGTDGPGNLNGEWAKIKNMGRSQVRLGGWWFRDSHLRWFKFPAGSRIPARRKITVYVGSRPSWDSNRRTHFYWRQRGAVFENAKRGRGIGDGGYIFDRQGDLRAWMMYPCRVACRDRLRGKVNVTAHPRAPEKVFVRNTSSSSIRLEGYVVDNFPWIYTFQAGTVLRPRERLRLVVKGSPRRNTRLVRYWNKRSYILNDRGDRVALRTQRDVRVDCYDWGRVRC
jgi:micrococcal nuclease